MKKKRRLGLSAIDRKGIWKEHMEKIMKIIGIRHDKADIVGGPAEKISHSEIINAIEAMKTGKAAGPSEVNVEMLAASGQVGKENEGTLPKNVGWKRYAR